MYFWEFWFLNKATLKVVLILHTRLRPLLCVYLCIRSNDLLSFPSPPSHWRLQSGSFNSNEENYCYSVLTVLSLCLYCVCTLSCQILQHQPAQHHRVLHVWSLLLLKNAVMHLIQTAMHLIWCISVQGRLVTTPAIIFNLEGIFGGSSSLQHGNMKK